MIIDSFWQYRDLIWQLSKRDVIGRYRGSFLGLIWSFINPLIMLAIYTFVFGFIFQARFGVQLTESKADYAVILFAGLIIHQFLAECITRSPSLIINNVNYVKKVVFPLEVLSWSCMFAALFHLLVSLLVLLGFYVYLQHTLQWTIVLFPLVIFPLIILIMGLCWFLSSLGVFIRDISQIMAMLTIILLFLSPVFYSVNNLPVAFRPFLYLNPLTYIIIQVRDVLLWGKIPNWFGLGIYLLIAIIIALLGYIWFRRTKHAFADVL
jgi:lipopolysaccharide transport system permease protein